jgi:hypothetical protein
MKVKMKMKMKMKIKVKEGSYIKKALSHVLLFSGQQHEQRSAACIVSGTCNIC